MRANVIIILALLISGLVGSLILEIAFKVEKYDSSRINDLRSAQMESSLDLELVFDVVSRSR
ncbi:hypothetical protein JW962_03555 [Candidatus Dojkabacteria bacterium]|nr:hypothetical protein [Candidatus Dojkabacteria bacterium]